MKNGGNYCLVFLLMIFAVHVSGQQEIRYIKGGISDAKSMAMKEGKLYMAVFYTDWCLPCKWMDENTFASTDVINFVSDYYVAVKVNIDDLDGHNARQQYNVEFLPTVLIFDQGGDVIERYEESISAKKLLEGLEKHRFNLENRRIRLSSTPPPSVRLSDRPTQAPSANVEDTKKETAVEKTPAQSPEPKKSTPQPSVESQTEPQRDTKEVQKPAEIPTPPRPVEKPADSTPKETPTKETPAPAAAKTQDSPATKETTTPPPSRPRPAADASQYYSVQVGTFSRFENADRLRDEYREIYGEGVHIKIDVEGGQTIYKVMIGRYARYEDAEPLLSLLKDQGTDGFIKSVSLD